MARISSLKRWLTLSEAVTEVCFLSEAYSILESDLLRLALDHFVPLSVVFPNGALAQPFKRIDESKIRFKEVPGIEPGTTVRLPMNGPVIYNNKGEALQCQESIFHLDDDQAYGLPMFGGGRAYVQRRFWHLKFTDREETSSLDGTFVTIGRGDDERYFRLLSRLPNEAKKPASYFPSGSLPEESVLVLTHSAIHELVKRLRSAENDDSSLAEFQATPIASRWPWGEHQTTLLMHLAEAAKQWWSSFEPDNNRTAPTNAEVSKWLQREKNVSRNMADAMATILRPDGLPTGPRT